MSDALRSFLVRFVKFGIVGGSGVVVNLGIYFLFTRGLGWQESLLGKNLSYLLSVEVSILTNFLLNDFWTFADRRQADRWRTRFFRFHVVSLVGMAVNWGIFAALNWLIASGRLELMGNLSLWGWHANVDDLIAACLGIIGAMAWNFLANLLWTWRGEKSSTPQG
jgi:dolichol-phosphate mannosyltransferase